MQITRIDTLQRQEFAKLLIVRLHTDEGLIGLGETWTECPHPGDGARL